MEDYNAKLKEYLLSKLKNQNDPRFGQGMSDISDSANQNNAQNALASSLMKSSAQMGSIGGRVADSSPVSDMANQLRGSNQDRVEQAGRDMQMQDNQYKMNADVYKYLAEKQQKDSDSLATAQFREKELGMKDKQLQAANSAKMAEKAENQRRFDQRLSLDRDRLAQGDRKIAADVGKKQDDKREKEDQYQAGIRVDGTDVKPGFRPTLDAAKKAKDAKNAYDKINAAMDEMDAIYAQSGTNLVGDDAARMSSLKTSILMSQKELDALGVLSGQDEKLTMDQVPDPTSYIENLKGMFGQDRYQAKADQYRKNLLNQYNASLGSSGYNSVEAPAKKVYGGDGTAIADDKPQVSTAEDSAAVQWAKANPNDPRSKDILRLNGGQ